ncbi:MAG: hypothetical protein IPL26_19655 [Leptospiraceae bacterium]|nr:hypothetical protein [Leptospiraceae bacterium]
MKIEDTNNMDAIIQGFKELNKSSIIVGVSEKGGKNIGIIAGANEFGAEIKSPKAIRYFWYLMGKYKKSAGVIDKSSKYKTGGKSGGASIIIPERSFLRSTADDKEVQNKLVETIEFYLERFLTGKNPAREVLTRAGQMFKRAIQSRIFTNIQPANHPLTVRLKGHDKTLQGKENKLSKSIDYEITS